MKRLIQSFLLLILLQILIPVPAALGGEGPPTIFLPLIYPQMPQILSYVEAQRGGMGLWYPDQAFLSPDERFMYLRSGMHGTIVVLQRDTITGKMSFVETVAPGSETESITSSGPMTISPDGKHVYADVYAGFALLTRDSATGRLKTTHIYSEQEGKPFDRSVQGMAVSPDGKYIYLTQSEHIALLKRDQQDGTLQYIKSFYGESDFPLNKTSLRLVKISRDGAFVYAISENQLLTFARNITTGELHFLQEQEVIPGNTDWVWMWDMEFGKEDRYLYISSKQDHYLGVFRRDPTTGLLQHIQSVTDIGNEPFQPGAIISSPDTGELIVTNNPNTLLRFYIKQSNGHLVLTGEQTVQPSAHDHPRFLKMLETKDGKNLYVTSGHNIRDDYVDGILAFKRNTQTGVITFHQLFSNADVGVPGLWGAETVLVSPDGRHVYATSIWENALIAFARNAQTGQLSYIDTYWQGLDGVDGLDFPRTLAITADGDFVLSGSRNSGKIAVFRRDSATGALTFTQAPESGMQSISWLTLSPDNNFVYVVGPDDRKMQVLSFNRQSGDLIPVQTVTEDEVLHASYVAVSPDGKHVYVAKRYDRYQSYRILLYDRNTQTGKLTFRPRAFNYAYDTSQIIFSADGRYAYVSSFGYDSSGFIFIEQRDPETGLLNFIQEFVPADWNDVNSLDDFEVISGVAITPNGKFVFAVSQENAALHAFFRNQQSGKLFWREVHKNGSNGIDSLEDASRVTVSPDGKHAYVASVTGTITVFEIAGTP